MFNKFKNPGVVYWGLLLLATLGLSALFIGVQWGSLNLSTPRESLLTVMVLPYLTGGYILFGAAAILSAVRRFNWLINVAYTGLLTATILAGAVVIATIWESHQVLEVGHWGMSNLYEVSILLLFMVTALALWFDARLLDGRLLPFLGVLTIASSVFLSWLYSLGLAGPREIVPALQSSWLPWHVLANFVGYGAFMVAACAGCVILVSRHTKVIERAQLVMDRSIMLGFPVFSVAIVLGAAWAYEAWGGYWSWDPKETWALIVWLVYAGYLHARLSHNWQPKPLALWSLVGFAVTLFCYLGVNMFMDGLHSYGQLG